MKGLVCIVIFITVVVFCFGTDVLAQEDSAVDAKAVKRQAKEEAKEEKTVVTGAMTGEVVYIFPKNDPKTIAVAFPEDDADYYFNLDNDLRVVHRQNIKQIQIGDTVEITYDKVTKKNKEGEEKFEKKAKILRYIKSTPKKGTLSSE